MDGRKIETETRFQRGDLRSDTGAKLAVYSQLPAGAPKAVVHIAHGLAEHAARYARFADALTTAGYGVVAHDHRGHGATTADDAPLGQFAKVNGWDKVMVDMTFINGHIRAQHPGVPVVLFGHSMGGMAAVTYLMRYGSTVDAVAIWNANVSASPLTSVLKLVLAAERALRGTAAPSVVNGLTFGAWNKKFKPNRTEFDWLSHDTAEVDAYVADPLCGWSATVSMWRDIAAAVDEGSNDAGFVNLDPAKPINLLGGDQDPATDGGAATLDLERRLKAAGATNLTTTILKNTRHESLNEVGRDATTAAFITWLDHVL